MSTSFWDEGYTDDGDKDIAYGHPASEEAILARFAKSSFDSLPASLNLGDVAKVSKRSSFASFTRMTAGNISDVETTGLRASTPIYCIIHDDTDSTALPTNDGSNADDNENENENENEKAENKIKPRRGTPEVTASDFFSSIVKTKDGRYFFSGVLNGWGGLSVLQLASLEQFDSLPPPPSSKADGKKAKKTPFDPTTSKTKFIWSANQKKYENVEPAFPDTKRLSKGKQDAFRFIRATLYLPKYTDIGYTRDNPGHVWYYNFSPPRISHGAKAISAAKSLDKKYSEATAQRVYHFGHRYAKEKETAMDRVSYHTGLLIEWSHGKYCTIFELAWRNGIGGYKGQSNWVEDKLAKPSSELYKMMPADMKLPWNSSKSEIRVIDVPMKNFEEFEKYLDRFTGPKERFLDAKIKESGDVLVRPNTLPDMIRYCVNRICADNDYSEPNIRRKSLGHNCQTFAGSFFGFLTNQKSPVFSMPSSFGMANSALSGFHKRQAMYSTPFDGDKSFVVTYIPKDKKNPAKKQSEKI